MRFRNILPPLKERNNNLAKEETYRKRKTNKMDYERNKYKLQTYQKKYAEKKGSPVKTVKHTVKYLKKKNLFTPKRKCKTIDLLRN